MTNPARSGSDLYVDWDEYHRSIEQLCLMVHESNWRFDCLLCLARGGLRVGDVISRIYDVPLAILAASSYRAAAGTRQGQLDIGEYITMTSDALRGNLLLVDDLVDCHLVQRRFGVQARLLCAIPTDESLDSSAVRGVRRDGSGETGGKARKKINP